MPQKPLSHQKSLANNTPSFSHHHHLAPLTLPATSALPSSQHILQAWCTSAHTHPRSLSLKLVSTGMQAQARTPVRDKRPLPSSPSLITSPRHPCKSITSHGQLHPPQPLSSLLNTKRLINGLPGSWHPPPPPTGSRGGVQGGVTRSPPRRPLTSWRCGCGAWCSSARSALCAGRPARGPGWQTAAGCCRSGSRQSCSPSRPRRAACACASSSVAGALVALANRC